VHAEPAGQKIFRQGAGEFTGVPFYMVNETYWARQGSTDKKHFYLSKN
jgi:hypothetical protein